MLDGDGAAAMPALSLPTLSFLKDPILLEDWPLDRDGKAEVFCARGSRRSGRRPQFVRAPRHDQRHGARCGRGIDQAADEAETGPAGEVAN